MRWPATILSLLRRGLGRRSPRPSPLPIAPNDPTSASVAALHVHVAEGTVVLSTTPQGAAAMRRACSARTPLRLHCPGERDVTLIPADPAPAAHPALDPARGWLIPLTPSASEELAEGVRAEPGQWELSSINLGVIVSGEEDSPGD